jgi:hypothetical protein
MTPNQLATRITRLRARPAITTQFERALDGRGTWSSTSAWYTSQKEHWSGWLVGYQGSGAYGRKNWHRSADFVYNHINCPPMVLWLGEASGLPKARVVEAKQAALSANPNRAPQCAAIRVGRQRTLWNRKNRSYRAAESFHGLGPFIYLCSTLCRDIHFTAKRPCLIPLFLRFWKGF